MGGLVCVVRRKEGFAGGLRVNTGSDEMVTNDGEVGSEDRETEGGPPATVKTSTRH